jgi:hypothetical protein
MSGTRLGDAAYGGRIYLVPAEHLLALPLAPPRCLPAVQRLIEQESPSTLPTEYRTPHSASLCSTATPPRRTALPRRATPTPSYR